MRLNNSRSSGFTIVELLLYISISASVLVAGSLFMATLFSGRIKHQAILEVEQQGFMLMSSITDSLRSAEFINSPTAGNSASTLSLDVLTAGNDPTSFGLSGATAQITEGVAAPITLTNSRVTVSSLSFQNLSRSGTPGTVRVSFTLTHVNPSNRQEYNYQKTFYGTSSLRHP